MIDYQRIAEELGVMFGCDITCSAIWKGISRNVTFTNGRNRLNVIFTTTMFEFGFKITHIDESIFDEEKTTKILTRALERAALDARL